MKLEHVNLTVSDLDRSVAFYCDVLGLEVRWQGHTSSGKHAAHVGNREMYLALFAATSPGRATLDYGAVGPNHFGLIVEDLDAVRPRLEAAGITPHLEDAYEPGRRLYFYDPDGMEVELVEYLDTGPA